MGKLAAAIFSLIQDQHPAKVRSLSNRIKSTSIENSSSLKGFFSTDTANNLLDNVLLEWQRLGCSSDEFAGLVVGASIGYVEERKREKIELVWTGPDLKQFPVRRSEQVLLDVINAANESLFIVSFVLVNVPVIEDAISKAVERGVDVRMLIESEDKGNSNDFRETAVRLHETIPGIMLYVWPRENRESAGGSFARVHAKCAVADSDVAFVTSANLTSAALDKNIEMGVRILGGGIPLDIERQFQAMIDTYEIVPYSNNQGTKPKKLIPISLEDLSVALNNSELATVRFRNEKNNIEETRVFRRCDRNIDKPKSNSIVAIEREGEILVGKYTWIRQQDMNKSEEKFYLVSVRGFKPTQSFKLTESEWADFYPLAVEEMQ